MSGAVCLSQTLFFCPKLSQRPSDIAAGNDINEYKRFLSPNKNTGTPFRASPFFQLCKMPAARKDVNSALNAVANSAAVAVVETFSTAAAEVTVPSGPVAPVAPVAPVGQV